MWSINKHFTWEAKLLLIVALAPVLVAIAAWAALSVRTWLAVDACLDSGGAYDYDHAQCVSQEPPSPTH